uniref:Retrotransposon gag domain-containing protein n=1 Tax=Tanacetum cinerariifolium TaxID=118510 RepID=A0A699HRJ8_TANCI|nr:hypothetical protein [Tanacetum cinerariifolium]
MVQTRNSENNNPPDPIAIQLAVIAAKLKVFETMKEDIAALKEGERSRSSWNDEGESSWRGQQPQRPYIKIDFLIFSSGDPRDNHFWEKLVQAFTRSFGLAEFQNPDEFLCSIKQTGSVHEYQQEFAKRSSRVFNWPDHCLLGVFLNGLKDELKSDVRIHKPRTRDASTVHSMVLDKECSKYCVYSRGQKEFIYEWDMGQAHQAQKLVEDQLAACQTILHATCEEGLKLSEQIHIKETQLKAAGIQIPK